MPESTFELLAAGGTAGVVLVAGLVSSRNWLEVYGVVLYAVLTFWIVLSIIG